MLDMLDRHARPFTRRLVGVPGRQLAAARRHLERRGATDVDVIPHGDRFAVYFRLTEDEVTPWAK